jgi:SH3 domain-containing YSC84-like protein 1
VVEQDNGRDQSFQTILSGKVPAPKSTLTFMKEIAQTGRAVTIAELKKDNQ